MDSSQGNFTMSSFPELENLIDAVLNQVQEEPLMDQPTSMDEGMDLYGMDSRIIIGITTVGVIGAIAIGSFGLYRFKDHVKDKLMEWYRSVINFLNVPILNVPY